jgi:hypothetical protein
VDGAAPVVNVEIIGLIAAQWDYCRVFIDTCSEY